MGPRFLSGKAQERKPELPLAWQPDKEGQRVYGKILQYKTAVGPNKQDLIVIDDQVRKEPLAIWLTAGLEGRVRADDIGKMIELEFIGPQKSKSGRDMKGYNVWVE